ncbi:hypothetical protein [Pseudomonas sp. HS6]|uniref:hypothetical protein n=1 Tax=Pseudomonas sp. HS6 TaxID=2850559 RepID=UPI002018C520|nr:hypothetical protein [Pseudomonas sp. HS6]UQS16667.1 hypothetical protein JJN09_07375 [Pseudomonas sp. HS6]
MQRLSGCRGDECEAGDEWHRGVMRQDLPRLVMTDKQVWIMPFKDMSVIKGDRFIFCAPTSKVSTQKTKNTPDRNCSF